MYVVLTKSKQLKEVRKFPGATRLYLLCNRIECENTAEAHSFHTTVNGFLYASLYFFCRKKLKCQFGDNCNFAHSLEEVDMWNYMSRNHCTSR